MEDPIHDQESCFEILFGHTTENSFAQEFADRETASQHAFEQQVFRTNVLNSDDLTVPHYAVCLDPNLGQDLPDWMTWEGDADSYLNLEGVDASDATNAYYNNRITDLDPVHGRVSDQSIEMQDDNQIFDVDYEIPNREEPYRQPNGSVGSECMPSTAALHQTQNVDEIGHPHSPARLLSEKSSAREKKSKISDKEWEDHKKIIHQIYIIEDYTMQQLIRTMIRDFKFIATEKMYRNKFKDWTGFSKNKTKQNGGRVAPRKIQRRRIAQKLPTISKKQQKSMLYQTHVEDNDEKTAPLMNPMSLFMDDITASTRMMYQAINNIIKGSFGSSRRVKGWTSDHIQLVPPAYASNNLSTWETLMDQCHCAGLLSEMKLYHCFSTFLHKIFTTIDAVAGDSPLILLIYLWRICSSIFDDFRLRGRAFFPGEELSPSLRNRLALMTIFFKRMRRSFSLRLGCQHPVVNLLEALIFQAKYPLAQFKNTLGLGYLTSIDGFGQMITTCHPVVLNMSSHYARQQWRTDTEGHRDTMRLLYNESLNEAKKLSGGCDEGTISLLYSYTYAMCKGYNDCSEVLNLASQLRDITEPICRNQADLKGGIVVRSFVFSTSLLAKYFKWQDSNLTRRQMNDAIEILRRGDQECLVYALALSKVLTLRVGYPIASITHRREARAEETKRGEAMRSKLREMTLYQAYEIFKGPDNISQNIPKNSQQETEKEKLEQLISWMEIEMRGQ
ncbi:hypothetical protein TWF225_000407 [Orbilia oligospora]|nr:hypothetical protein TWF225_000407 [Orbilia oligospora]KAF3254143.1 hypothetical protein TWF128_006270 [Orbilia oligospora]KAF3272030.1 hypothetical protein TWF217_003847 [Orbilia oligospora]KAF3297804.1 hypothetical protein TWF132_006200 [Orbilia oligospora]